MRGEKPTTHGSRQGDTIKEPKHLDKNGEIRRFHRVIANPPFFQNYTTNGMLFRERFHTFMPESGKKADLMFVQHMVASLRGDGKMAVVRRIRVNVVITLRRDDKKAARPPVFDAEQADGCHHDGA